MLIIKWQLQQQILHEQYEDRDSIAASSIQQAPQTHTDHAWPQNDTEMYSLSREQHKHDRVYIIQHVVSSTLITAMCR